MSDPVDRALARAAGYLVSIQEPDGCWRDYHDRPVGPSDQWVTAYVALALSELPPSVHCGAPDAGADWLLRNHCWAEGWGYNAHTGVDADSTAHAVLLLAARDRRIPASCAVWLGERWHRDGGFATYPRADAWGIGHPCVTPVVWEALVAAGHHEFDERAKVYLQRTMRSDGRWNAYWWRGTAYATSAALRALARRNGVVPVRSSAPAADGAHGAHSAFEVACEIATMCFRAQAIDADHELLRSLLWRQRADGSWPGADNLRLTAPECHAPWEHACGSRYVDWCGTITTATCVRALNACLNARRSDGQSTAD